VPLTVVYNSQYSLLAWAKQISSLENPPLAPSVSRAHDFFFPVAHRVCL